MGRAALRIWDWFAETRQALWLVWALYLVPRALLILLNVQPWSDADFYYDRAAELADGQGYRNDDGTPTAFWPPGWPLVLAGVFRLLGPSVEVVGLLNLIFAGLSAVLILRLGRRITGSEGAARLALLLVALYPNNAAYVPLALTEVFYTLLLLAVCWLLVERRGAAALIGAGVLLGLATLVKAQSLVVVPLVLGLAVLRETQWLKALPAQLGRGIVLVLLAGLVVLPWTLRNERVLGAPVAVSTNGGWTLATGNNPEADGGYSDRYAPLRALHERRAAIGEPAFDAEARRIGQEWIAANPGAFAALMPRKLAKLWGPDGEALWNYQQGAAAYAAAPALFHAVRAANQIWYWLLLALFAAAFAVQLGQRRRTGERLVDWWLLPYGLAAYPTAICLVFSGQSRFHYPVMPFIAMSAAWLLAAWLERRRGVVVEP